ncbi:MULTISPECIES: hypothetical protein [Cyanophyceae]|uniref:hypothetical protein n=1 Tax=Cyanophyceae TaxID=3028117 RepID=UPI0016851D3C|nr:hypothetical protein [Trichocoleus sp. FACHB-69]MBD1930480.1 hypothetical protein [Trichocoleus sp. FACHB-69]
MFIAKKQRAIAGIDTGKASGTDWGLSCAGDSFTSAWTFTNLGSEIASLTINAIPGNAVFDTGSVPSTPGSAFGQPFLVTPGTAPTSFNYSVPIDISLGELVWYFVN